ncbi:MAG: glycosyltransferase [Polyangiales bacterium]
MSLRHLTIKPFTPCTHACPYCDSRQELFDLTRDRIVGLDDWARLFAEADTLGAEYLDISGGEPSLYKGLAALVWEAKVLGWFVSMNSTGEQVTPSLLGRLHDAGLDQIIMSMMSLDEATHDRLRGKRGSFAEAVAAIEAMRETPIRLVLHFILSRHNARELPALVDQAFEWGARAIALVYPENDHERDYLRLRDDDIEIFRRAVIPAAMERYADRAPSRPHDLATIAGLFASHGRGGDFARGRYWSSLEEIHGLCDKPERFALVYANGDVLPCNAVEYTHAPVVGNILETPFSEIWTGDRYAAFRREKMAFCGLCPIKRHTGVSVASTDNPPYAAPVVKRVPQHLAASRPPVDEVTATTRVPGRRLQWWSGGSDGSKAASAVTDRALAERTIYFVTDWWLPKIGGLERSIEYLSHELSSRFHLELLTGGSSTRADDEGALAVVRLPGDEAGAHHAAVVERVLRSPGARPIVHLFGFSFRWPREHAAMIDALKRGGASIVLKVPTTGDATRHLRDAHAHVTDRIDRFVALNEEIAAELYACGVPEARIARIPNGVPTRRFVPVGAEARAAAKRALGLDSSRPVLGFAGRFVRRKRVDLLIDAVKATPAARRPRLLLVGETDATFGDGFDVAPALDDDVSVVPMRSEMALVYHAMDGYASASEAEGMSNACLEAMASGLPLVVSDIAGQRELVGGAKGGWVFTVGSLRALTDAISQFTEALATGEASERGRWARRKAVRDHDERLVADRYEALYRTLDGGGDR